MSPRKINGPSLNVATAKSVVEISPPHLWCHLWSREGFLAAEGVGHGYGEEGGGNFTVSSKALTTCWVFNGGDGPSVDGLEERCGCEEEGVGSHRLIWGNA